MSSKDDNNKNMSEPLTPQKVIEEMSFHSPASTSSQRHVPVAPPPASAPPPPPPLLPLKRDEDFLTREQDMIPSYHDNNNTRSVISKLRGDASLNPNTGQSNSAEGDGTALVQVVWRIRLINICVCAVTLAIQLPPMIFGTLLLTKSLAQVVLCGYLLFFVLVLLCFELRPTPWVAEQIHDLFGILYHALSRVVFLLLLAGLSCGQGGLQAVLGIVLMMNGLYTLFVYTKYPEYRRIHYEQEESFMKRFGKRRRQQVANDHSWANPDLSLSTSGNDSFMAPSSSLSWSPPQQQQHGERQPLL